ncbi:hypothetical protein Tco_0026961 [Tanacetum coccineum]
MRLNELHKFSDGTLTRVMEKLDQMVKDFHLFEYNKGMETRKCMRIHNEGTTQGKSTIVVEVLKGYRLQMEMEMDISVAGDGQVSHKLPQASDVSIHSTSAQDGNSLQVDLNNLNFFDLDYLNDHSDVPNDKERSDPSPNRYDIPSPHSGSTYELLNESEGGQSQGSNVVASEE